VEAPERLLVAFVGLSHLDDSLQTFAVPQLLQIEHLPLGEKNGEIAWIYLEI